MKTKHIQVVLKIIIIEVDFISLIYCEIECFYQKIMQMFQITRIDGITAEDDVLLLSNYNPEWYLPFDKLLLALYLYNFS